jgi:hypothetical protein
MMMRILYGLGLGVVLMAAGLGAAEAESRVITRPVVTHVDGKVMLRDAKRPWMELPKVGREVAEGEVLITGDRSLLEVKVGEPGMWRLGRRAVLIPGREGGRLMAGTALVRVPAGAGWRIESTRGAARLGTGLWMVQAVDNEGLKLVCLDGPAEVVALGEGADAEPSKPIKLRPGELVFLSPDGKGFGVIVTIYLEELLVTSRLVNGFPAPLPEQRRLMNLALAQREQLKGVTNAVVAGARKETGFEIAVPKPRGSAPKK